jgi:hypothetical protein
LPPGCGRDHHAARHLFTLVATQHLHGGTRKERYNATRWDVAIAMTIAGFVNLAMMATAAAAFHFNGHTGLPTRSGLSDAGALLSHAAATIFGLSLVAAVYHRRWWEPGRAGGDAGLYPLPYSAVVSPRSPCCRRLS